MCSPQLSFSLLQWNTSSGIVSRTECESPPLLTKGRPLSSVPPVSAYSLPYYGAFLYDLYHQMEHQYLICVFPHQKDVLWTRQPHPELVILELQWRTWDRDHDIETWPSRSESTVTCPSLCSSCSSSIISLVYFSLHMCTLRCACTCRLHIRKGATQRRKWTDQLKKATFYFSMYHKNLLNKFDNPLAKFLLNK